VLLLRSAERGVKTRADLFHSKLPDSENYATVPSKTGVMTTHAISSREFKSWVTGEYYRDTGDGLTGEQMNSVLATIHAIAAHDSPELPVSDKRVAECNGRYYYYLADDAQTVIEYSAVGWSVCENSLVRFVYDKYKAPIPIPSKNGSIDKLWKLTRIKDTEESPDRLMIVSALVKGLVPGGSDLILAISGYAGSGKTTTAKFIRALIDPFTKGKVLSKLPENSDNIAIHAMKRRILAVDNVSHITSDQSDFLCTVVSLDSGGTSKREHHTNSGEIIHDVQNLVILTSIGNVVTKPDLLERSIVIDLPILTPEDRESEAELGEIFDRHHGEILSGLLDITVAALHYRDNSPCPKFNRLTEFAHIGEGVEKKLKYPIGSIKKRFADNANIAHEIAIDSSPVGSTLRSWILSNEGVWTGTTSDLLNILKSHAKKSELAGSLPKTANSLGGELKKCESALAQCGILIEDFRESLTDDPNRTKKKKVYVKSRLPKTSENLSPSSPTPKIDHPEPIHSKGLEVGVQVGEQVEVIPPVTESSLKADNLKPSHSKGLEVGERVGEQSEGVDDDEYPNQDEV
jgi:ABC-type oligopeptide transport system ATPase subunit